ncbi:uncharacterized protein LOC121381827 [Gigantopelta aegis]|uniref:uncharacterized protein LOC121381827 n=1 Tax=Gigantopelta aegis TaxID=1735272 RepID=UPI001B88DDE6|nr:uncharacterized protein LOC121381827 [Gigantopelta aegis]
MSVRAFRHHGERSVVLPQVHNRFNWSEQSMPRSPLDRRHRDVYNSAYRNLTKQIVYIHPNPGPAIQRKGKYGADWRHIRQSVQPTGAVITSLNGNVKLYDADKFTDALQHGCLHRPHLESVSYIPGGNTWRGGSSTIRPHLESVAYIPRGNTRNVFSLQPSIPFDESHDDFVRRKLSLQLPYKYKGLYRYK